MTKDKTDSSTCLKCPDISLFETYCGSQVCSKCAECMLVEKKRLDSQSETTYNELNRK
jgi:hypothetical protein